MKSMPKRHTLLAALIATLAAGAASASPASVSLAPSYPASASDTLPQATVAASDPFVAADGLAHIVVVLQGEPAAHVWSRELARHGSGTSGRAMAAQNTRAAISGLEAQQADLLARARSSGIDYQHIYSLQRTLNGVVLRAAPGDMDRLRALPGVERVEFVPLHEPTNGSSVPFIGAPQAWGNTIGLPAGVTGTGMRVGIIDTGIDYQHPAFGGTGALVDYQANDRTVITDQIGGNPIYPTAKVVGGFDFAGDNYNAAVAGQTTPAPDPDPMDCNGHGSHVAGTAAAFGVTLAGTTYPGPFDAVTDYSTLRIGPGVAPEASLFALRVFGCGGSTTLTASAIEWSTDPNDDGDLSDRLDVINMSLGSNYGLPFDLTTEASDNAALVGVVVVASAGNAGDTFFISGSPGAGGRVIATANSLDGGLAGAKLVVNSPPSIAATYPAAATAYTDSNGVPAPANQVANLVLVDDGSTAGSGTVNDGCQTPFVNAAQVAGNFVLVERGACNFTVKTENAQANGAIGIIIANNLVGDPVPNIAGGSTAADITIPGITVSRATGDLLRTEIALGPVNVTLGAADAGDTLNSGSSRGPRGGGQDIFLKPDLAAPGTSITSVQTGVVCNGVAPTTGCIVSNGTGFIPDGATLTISGTSMAAPHVAGQMALLRQANPTLSVEELKAMAISSSRNDVSVGADGGLPRFPASRVGSGRVDVPAALSSPVYALNDEDEGAVSVVFVGEPTATVSQQKTVRLVNRSAIAQNVTLSIDTVLDAPGVSVAILGATSASIPALGSTTVDVQVTLDPAQMDRNRDPSLAATQSVTAPAGLASLGAVARHFLTEESALLKVSAGATEVSRVPIYVAQRPHGTLAAPTTPLPGSPSAGTASLPLSGIGVCTGSAGPGGCTATFPNDQASLVSPFELQITEPLLPTVPPFASVRHVGVNHDPASGLFFFGVVSHGEWSSPTNVSYNICIDTNEDGTFDRVLFNSDLGNLARLFGQNVPGQDTFLTGLFTPPGTLGVVQTVNLFNAAQLDTVLLDTNAMVLAATATQLGMTPGDARFNYAVATCPGSSNPLCVRLSPATACSAAGAFQVVPGVHTYDGNARGLTSSGGLSSLPIMIPASPAQNLNFAYDQANLAANGSEGILLIHHHNTSATRTQTLTFDAPPTDPTATGAATPSAAAAGQETVLTVTVVPGTNPTSTGISVTADLSSIGGSASQSFADDGLGDDVAAGDNIFTHTATVAPGSALGPTSFDVDVVDAQSRTATTTIAFEVLESTDPSGVGLATPANVQSGETSLLTVTVTPGTNPASTGITVEVDLSAVGGSANQAMFDNGTNGDVTAGDNVFSVEAAIGGVPGSYTLTATIEDAQARSATADIDVTIDAPLEEFIFADGFEQP